MNRSKQWGTMAETAFCDYVQDEVGVECMRRVMHGGKDRGDARITGVPLMIEIKHTKTIQFGPWEREVARQVVNAEAQWGVLVWSPPKLGVKSIERWVAIDWPDTTMTPWGRRGYAYDGPFNRLHEVVARHAAQAPIYIPNDDATGLGTKPPTEWARCRVRHLHQWVDDLRETIAAGR